MVGTRIVILGGGITGLAAAWELAGAMPEAQITVLDAADRPGGKLRREPVAGVAVDVGAEAVLARRPEALTLMTEVGLGADVEHPATTSASIWSRGDLHPLPKGTLLGIPSQPAAALGILSPREVARAEREEPWPGGEFDDVSLGDYVATRLGDAVVDRLVEPLLGGVYAGQSRSLSLRACVPTLFDAVSRGESLTVAARAAASNGDVSDQPAPVFAGVAGGVGRLAEVLSERLRASGVTIRSGTIARELHREPDSSGGGWSVVVGSRAQPTRVRADAVILAVPATPASRLLAHLSAQGAHELAGIQYASMAIVTLAVASTGRGPDRAPLIGSGFLVPPVEGRTIKASTFTSTKWRWAANAATDLSFLRASVGRHGETSDLQRPDDELVALAFAEVSEALGHQLPPLVDAHVQRWGGALPQYAVGHLARVARIRAAVADLPGLALAGAAYDGVGVPACIASGRTAAQAVLTHLRSRQGDAGE